MILSICQECVIFFIVLTNHIFQLAQQIKGTPSKTYIIIVCYKYHKRLFIGNDITS